MNLLVIVNEIAFLFIAIVNEMEKVVNFFPWSEFYAASVSLLCILVRCSDLFGEREKIEDDGK